MGRRGGILGRVGGVEPGGTAVRLAPGCTGTDLALTSLECLTISGVDTLDVASIDAVAADLVLTADQVTIADALTLSTALTPAALTANTDNWSPAGLSTALVVRVSADALRNLTGIAAGTDGRVLILVNVGSFNVSLKDDQTSTAANRFLCPNAADFALTPASACTLVYDATSARWRVIGKAL